MANIRNLVFSGAGVAGTAYVGAMKQLEKKLGSFNLIRRVAGTSSGSIMAMMVALNCNSTQIEKNYANINFAKIPDHKSIFSQTISFFKQSSIYDGNYLRKIIHDLLVDNNVPADITFEDFKKRGYKDLYVVTTKMYERDGEGTCEPQIFSAETTPKTSVLLAIVASASIPGLFPPVYLREKEPGYFIECNNGFAHVDGGLTCNFAIEIFDKKKYKNNLLKDFDETITNYFDNNKDQTVEIAKNTIPDFTDKNFLHFNDYYYNPQTYGLLIYSGEQIKDVSQHSPVIKPIPPHHLIKSIEAILYGAILGTQNYIFRHSRNLPRTILISDKNISAINFDINTEQKEILIQSGKDAVEKFFKTNSHTLPENQTTKPSIVKLPSLQNNNALLTSPLHKPRVQSLPPKNNKSHEHDLKRSFCTTS